MQTVLLTAIALLLFVNIIIKISIARYTHSIDEGMQKLVFKVVYLEQIKPVDFNNYENEDLKR
jgi:hypothetical protein